MREDNEFKELNKDKKKVRERKGAERGRIKTEKVIMLASSVMLLSGLTATGIYFRANQKPTENMKIDLTGMEDRLNEKANDILDRTPQENIGIGENSDHDKMVEDNLFQEKKSATESDLDYDPAWMEDSKQEREASNQVSGEVVSQTHVEDIEAQLDQFMTNQSEDSIVDKEEDIQKNSSQIDEESKKENLTTSSSETDSLSFSENSQLAWPIVGPVIMDYSMDQTVYYQTLDQYRYQPGMVIGASEGDTICAAASCQVMKIENDSVLGNTVTMNLGNGYELLYGQLGKLKVKEGDFLKTGDIVGFVSQPTKYYSVEGTNLYIELRKDGQPVNPMTLLP